MDLSLFKRQLSSCAVMIGKSPRKHTHVLAFLGDGSSAEFHKMLAHLCTRHCEVPRSGSVDASSLKLYDTSSSEQTVQRPEGR